MIIGDNELLALYLGNDDIDALNQLVNRHSRLVYSICRKMLWRAEDAEDAFQIVFLLLCKKAPKLLKHNSLGGWLHNTSVLTCLKLRRKIQRTREVNMGPEPIEVADQSNREPWQTIASASDIETLHHEIQRLPARYREVIVLCHLEGKSRAQAAALLDCTTASVKAALAHGRKQLRQRLLKHGIAATVVLESSNLVPAVGEKSVQAVEAMETAKTEVENEHAISHSLQPLILATLLKCQELNEPGTAASTAVGSGSGIVNAFIQKESSTMSFAFTKASILVASVSILLGGLGFAASAANPNRAYDSNRSIVVLQHQDDGLPVSFRAAADSAESQQEQETDKVDPAAKTADETWDEYVSRLYDIKVINEDQLAEWRDGKTVTVAGGKAPFTRIEHETRTRKIPVTTMKAIPDGKGGTRNVPETKEIEQAYTVAVPKTTMVDTQLIIPAWDSKPEDATNPGFQLVKEQPNESRPMGVSELGKQYLAQFKPSVDDATYDEVDPETVQIRGWTSGKGERCTIVEDKDGMILRLFVDSNKDRKLDRWMYYSDGKLSYVDADTNFDSKVDRAEFFSKDTVRVGVDENKDGKFGMDEWSEQERSEFEMYDEP